MLSLLAALWIFYTLLSLSAAAAGILLVSYQRQGQNLLLRSCCFALFLLYGSILVGHIGWEALTLRDDEAFCETQAIILNYVYICIHAHACFMMLSNCYVAMGWKLRIFEKHVDRESTLVLMSYAVPMLYIAAFAFIRANHPHEVVVRNGLFYCSLSQPRWTLTIFWFMLYAVPGSILAVYLLVKTWKARQRTLAFGNATQLTLPYLLRLTTSTLVYIVVAWGSFLPLTIYSILTWNGPPASSIGREFELPDATVISGPSQGFAQSMAALLTYLPAILGIALFLMYGFGTHARASYKYFADKLLQCRPKRRNSTLPLMHGLSTTQTIQTKTLASTLIATAQTHPSPLQLPIASPTTVAAGVKFVDEATFNGSGPSRRSI